jgi:NAD-dependent DNA ligase
MERKARKLTHQMAARVGAAREWHELRRGEGISAKSFGGLGNRRVAVSGRLPDGHVRPEFRSELERAGALYTDTIKNGHTDLLIVGTGAGSKLRLARERRVPRMSYLESRKLLRRKRRR